MRRSELGNVINREVPAVTEFRAILRRYLSCVYYLAVLVCRSPQYLSCVTIAVLLRCANSQFSLPFWSHPSVGLRAEASRRLAARNFFKGTERG